MLKIYAILLCSIQQSKQTKQVQHKKLLPPPIRNVMNKIVRKKIPFLVGMQYLDLSI